MNNNETNLLEETLNKKASNNNSAKSKIAQEALDKIKKFDKY